MDNIEIVDVTPGNVLTETLFCVKNISDPGFLKKNDWFSKRYQEGLRIRMLKNASGKPIAFIEFVPSKYAWRPVEAPTFMFIHCMFTYANSDKLRGYGSLLLQSCEQEAKEKGFDGVCVMSSDGSWIANKNLFLLNGYSILERKGRFELLAKKFNPAGPDPVFIDWTLRLKEYKGWHLVYADQCPWHEKSVKVMVAAAKDIGIDLQVRKLTNSDEAKQAPSGFGVFSLLKDGRLIEDHYLSETRFRTILKKEMSS
jgi:hypothetical protein